MIWNFEKCSLLRWTCMMYAKYGLLGGLKFSLRRKVIETENFFQKLETRMNQLKSSDFGQKSLNIPTVY